MSKKANFFGIGLFVIAAFLTAGASILFFGSGSFNKQTAEFLVTFEGSANGIREGAQVKAYGVEIGSVTRIMLHQDEVSKEIFIPILIELDLNTLSDLLGYQVVRDYDDETYQMSIDAGMHAKLNMQSAVTGMLYVELEYGLSEEGFLLEHERFAGYRQFPTVPTDMQVMMGAVQNIFQNLGETDFKGLVAETTGTMADIREDLEQLNIGSVQTNFNALVTDVRGRINDPKLDQTVDELNGALSSFRQAGETFNERATGTLEHVDESVQQLTQTLREVEQATVNAKAWLDPSNSIYRGVIESLDKMGDASRSLRILLDYVERNPNAFITGKKSEEPKP